jgi:hypothetical protein
MDQEGSSNGAASDRQLDADLASRTDKHWFGLVFDGHLLSHSLAASSLGVSSWSGSLDQQGSAVAV